MFLNRTVIRPPRGDSFLTEQVYFLPEKLSTPQGVIILFTEQV